MNELLLDFAIAVGLGMLVGLQRERVGSQIAGLRTFGLVALLGAICGHLGPWAIGTGILAVTGLTVVGNLARMEQGEPKPGMTTEVAVVVMFLVGALIVTTRPVLGVAVSGATAGLLHFKKQLHGVAHRIGARDFDSIIQFALLTLVILPVLPDETYGPYDVLNPREIWLMVVLIVGIGLGGYIGYKFLGHRGGVLAAGILGGTISSTATTVTYARRERKEAVATEVAFLVILLASAVVYVRVMVEIAVVAPSLIRSAAPPLSVVFVTLSILSAVHLRRDLRTVEDEGLSPGNPTQLKPAVLFGLAYGAVLLGVAFAQDHLGSAGLYLVGVLSGFAKMDAITLSTSRMVSRGALEPETAWRVILVASMANLVFKAGIVALWGGRALLRRLLVWWGVAFLVAGAVLWWWPG